jgi:hypothetical protein
MKTGKPKKMPFAAKGKPPAPGAKKMPPWLQKPDAGGAKPAFKKGGKVKC